MSFQNWNSWNEIDVKRIEKAKGKDLTPLSIDNEAGTAVFASSDGGTYNTSTESCECVDFARHFGASPCKHICRLAMELGLIDSTGMQSDPIAAKHKLDKANLLALAREGDLFQTATLFQALQRIADKESVKYADFVDRFWALYLVSETKGGKCKIEKPLIADLNTACGIIEKRLGELLFGLIDRPAVQDALTAAIQDRMNEWIGKQ